MQLFSKQDFQYLYENCFTEHDRGNDGFARFLHITDEGVFYNACLLEGGTALKLLRWKPVHELTGPNKPSSSGPALPFPFTARQLTAFMLWGWGSYFEDAFGRLDSGPNEFVLSGEHEDGADANEALRQAYDIFQDARRVVGELDHDQKRLAHELMDRYGDAHDRALYLHNVMEPGISQSDYRLRRRRARAPIAPLKMQAEEAMAQADAAFKSWRKAMVRQLLQPQQADTQPQAGTVKAAPVVKVPASKVAKTESKSGNWKMKIQVEAASRFKRLRASGASPTVHSILDDMVNWCRANDVKTDNGIYPKAGYLRTHVLGGKHWTPPR